MWWSIEFYDGGADSWHQRESRVNHSRWLIHFGRDRDKRHPGDADGKRRQHLYPADKWRNTDRQSGRDHNLHGNCKWRRWENLRKRNRNGNFESAADS